MHPSVHQSIHIEQALIFPAALQSVAQCMRPQCCSDLVPLIYYQNNLELTMPWNNIKKLSLTAQDFRGKLGQCHGCLRSLRRCVINSHGKWSGGICCLTFPESDSEQPEPRLNIKTVYPRYGDSHVKDTTVGETLLSLTWESLYLQDGIFILRRPLRLIIVEISALFKGNKHLYHLKIGWTPWGSVTFIISHDESRPRNICNLVGLWFTNENTERRARLLGNKVQCNTL